jgi:hypothetical protein
VLYLADRRAEHAEALLGNCRGFLHDDGYAGCHLLYVPDPSTGESRLIEIACWSHARCRPYEGFEAIAAPLAKEALERIAEPFAIEAQIVDQGLRACAAPSPRVPGPHPAQRPEHRLEDYQPAWRDRDDHSFLSGTALPPARWCPRAQYR